MTASCFLTGRLGQCLDAADLDDLLAAARAGKATGDIGLLEDEMRRIDKLLSVTGAE